MQRKFFDVFASAIGAVMVVALVVAGSLLMWGYSFANSNVHNQLAAQDITFPTAASSRMPSRAPRSLRRCCPTCSSTPGNP